MAVRFSANEEKWLREGYKLFGEGNKGRKQEWVDKTLHRFPFHPSRTRQSLQQKWQQMNK